MPTVSVVIPTLGRPQLACRAVSGVLTQTMADLEVLVVIDGDDKATRSALQSIGDHRLRVLSHETNRGAGYARDTGVAASSGEWIAFLDDDDEWAPEKLERQLALAAAGKAVIMTRSRVVYASSEFIQPTRAYDNLLPIDEWLFDRRTWLKGGQSFLQTSSLMFPREIFAQVRFGNATHEEWEAIIRAVKQYGYPLLTAEEPLVTYYVPEKRPALSKTHTWRKSIEWLHRVRDMLTPRAASGFCLTVVARLAANAGERGAILPLLREAFAVGQPTAKQLLAFALIWVFPDDLRRTIRRLTSPRV